MSDVAIPIDTITRDITETLRDQIVNTLHRRGAVLGMSGGVDSSVCAALAVRAMTPERVFALMMPEHDSDPESVGLAERWAKQLGIRYEIVDITPVLRAFGCYEVRDAAIRRVVPEFASDWKCKIVLPGNRLQSDRLNVFTLAVQPPGGEIQQHRLPPDAYREIVAATNFKQRVRKMFEYFHADRLHYAVIGTPNRLEYDQGFFVKGGDGLADVKPIAHLYKGQVYELAAHLGVPEEVTTRPPTTDTYSLPQTQEEFYFLLPSEVMDRALHAHNRGLSAEEAATTLGCTTEQVARAYREIEQKRSTTRYQHLSALLIQHIPEISVLNKAGQR